MLALTDAAREAKPPERTGNTVRSFQIVSIVSQVLFRSDAGPLQV